MLTTKQFSRAARAEVAFAKCRVDEVKASNSFLSLFIDRSDHESSELEYRCLNLLEQSRDRNPLTLDSIFGIPQFDRSSYSSNSCYRFGKLKDLYLDQHSHE